MRYHFTTIIAIILLSAVGVSIAFNALGLSLLGAYIPSAIWDPITKIAVYILFLSPGISLAALIFAIIGRIKTKSSESKGVIFVALAVLIITIVGYLLLFGWLALIASSFIL